MVTWNEWKRTKDKYEGVKENILSSNYIAAKGHFDTECHYCTHYAPGYEVDDDCVGCPFLENEICGDKEMAGTYYLLEDALVGKNNKLALAYCDQILTIIDKIEPEKSQ